MGFVTAAQRGGATLVALDGSVIDHLDGFRLAGNPENDGVWLQEGRNHFRLDSRRGRLVPEERARARTRIYAARPEPDLAAPPGARYRGRVAGSWSYVLKGPGHVSLAQWSGECESPMSFWLTGDRSVSLVTGKRRISGPESIALGWGPDGSAYAYLGEGLCGSRADPPGIYRFTAPGNGHLVYRTRFGVQADMW